MTITCTLCQWIANEAGGTSASEAAFQVVAERVPSACILPGAFVHVDASAGVRVALESCGTMALAAANHVRAERSWGTSVWMLAFVHIDAAHEGVANEALGTQARVIARSVLALGVLSAHVRILAFVNI